MNLKHVGFTGTRNDLTTLQYWRLEAVLALLQNMGAEWLHHGDCQGADAAAHDIAHGLGYKICVHPPDVHGGRAFCKLWRADMKMPNLPYLERNKRIVEHAQVLVATPKGRKEVVRSGTWATIRYGRAAGLPIRIIWPATS